MKKRVTAQTGLRIYCADRKKTWWPRASSPSRSDFIGWMRNRSGLSERLQKRYKVLCFAILCLLIQLTVGIGASAAEEEQKDYILGRPMTQEEIQAQKDMEPELKPLAPYNIPPLEELESLRARMALPASYDSRTQGCITPVKNQSPWGDCWAFAFQSTLEANLVKSGWDKEALDLSEQHLAYFTYYPAADAFGNTSGDRVQINLNDGGNKAMSYLDFGGNAQWAMTSMSTWTGAADESVSVYPGNAYTPGLDASLAYQDKVHLQNAYYISTGDRNTLKKWIMDYGAAYIAMNYSSMYYNFDTGAYNYTGGGGMNHAVTVVGWSDSYRKENFNEGCRPKNNGAWLIKNSYGEGWGLDGYFWLSYEDAYLSRTDSYAFVFKGEPADNYEHIYQYDGTCGSDFVQQGSGVSAANVFTASSGGIYGEEIEAVSFMTMSPNLTYKIQVYTGVEETGNPESGVSAFTAEQTGTVDYAGYHTIPLKTKVRVGRGEKFTVMITFTRPNGVNVLLNVDSSYSMGDINFFNSTKPGQSFLKVGEGEWYDGAGHGYSVRVKAFTSDALTPDPNPKKKRVALKKITLSKSTLTMTKGTSRTLKTLFNPSNTTDSRNIVWSTGNSSVARVKNGVVKAVKPGTARITAKCGKLQAQCAVTVKKQVIKLSKTKLTLYTAGKRQILLKASMTGPKKAISFKSSNRRIAKVDKNGKVTALRKGSVVITASSGSMKRNCKITVKNPYLKLKKNSVVLKRKQRYTIKASAVPKGRITYRSTNAKVASVNKDGIVKGLGKGTARIKVKCYGVSKYLKVTVR